MITTGLNKKWVKLYGYSKSGRENLPLFAIVRVYYEMK